MNVLIIFADQMHRYALGKRNPQVQTPILDKLCEEGVLFTNAYSNNPVCTPFRGNLFTGLYTCHNRCVHNDDPLPSDIPAMADYFKNAGYGTSYVGKWHLGGAGNVPIPKELRGGFEKFIGYQCYNGFKNNVVFFDEENNAHSFEQHRTKVETDLTIEKIEQLHKEGRPFLQVLSYQAPHYPVQPSEEFEKFYEGVVFTQTPDFVEIDPFTQTYSPPSPVPFELDPDYQRYGNNMQAYLRLYYAMVTELDYGVGRIMDKLDELGIREETIVIFTADHGDMQGSHGFNNKCQSYEKSCGIPMIYSVPKGKKNVVSDALVSGVDILPTILELNGLPMPVQYDGQSLSEFLTFEKKEVKAVPVFAESAVLGVPWRMVRRGDFKLTMNWKTKEPTLLFNMKEDPYEMNNLVHEDDYTKVVEELAEIIMSI